MVNGNMMDNCTNQVCPANMDRCYALAYTLEQPEIGDLKMNVSLKGCNNKDFCALSHEQVCAIINNGSDNGTTANDCQMACSEQNNVVLPGPEGKEYITIMIMIWLILPTLIYFFCY